MFEGHPLGVLDRFTQIISGSFNSLFSFLFSVVANFPLFPLTLQLPLSTVVHTHSFLSFEILAGECRLENMRTLCVACHADITAAQHTERRLTRLVAKKKLKAVMSNLKSTKKPKQKVDEAEVCFSRFHWLNHV